MCVRRRPSLPRRIRWWTRCGNYGRRRMPARSALRERGEGAVSQWRRLCSMMGRPKASSAASAVWPATPQRSAEGLFGERSVPATPPAVGRQGAESKHVVRRSTGVFGRICLARLTTDGVCSDRCEQLRLGRSRDEVQTSQLVSILRVQVRRLVELTCGLWPAACAGVRPSYTTGRRLSRLRLVVRLPSMRSACRGVSCAT